LSVADADVLFAEHRQGVFRYLCRMVGRVETARDLTQEVFLRVARAGAPDADAAGRRAWVFCIARNLALNHVRDHRREGLAVDPADTAAPAVQELGAAIREALAALQDLDRDVTGRGALSLFDALPKELGLKLEQHKRPLPVLVIDHIERQPTDR
jgi:DNA-directed RNA polymerase specialized sigma24 family protein